MKNKIFKFLIYIFFIFIPPLVITFSYKPVKADENNIEQWPVQRTVGTYSGDDGDDLYDTYTGGTRVHDAVWAKEEKGWFHATERDVDLGDIKAFDGNEELDIDCGYRNYKGEIDYSSDDVNWTKIYGSGFDYLASRDNKGPSIWFSNQYPTWKYTIWFDKDFLKGKKIRYFRCVGTAYTSDAGIDDLVVSIRKNPIPRIIKTGVSNTPYQDDRGYWVKPQTNFQVSVDSDDDQNLSDYLPNRIYYSFDKSDGTPYGKIQTSCDTSLNNQYYYDLDGKAHTEIPCVSSTYTKDSASHSVLTTYIKDDNQHYRINCLSSKDYKMYTCSEWSNISTINSDGSPPNGNNLRIINVTDNGYDVYIDNVVDPNDGSGLKNVKFTVYTPSKVKSYDAIPSYDADNQYYTNINFSDFDNSTHYLVCVEASDNVGNVSNFRIEYNAPIAQFKIPSWLFVKTPITYEDTSYDTNNPKQEIKSREFQWSTDESSWSDEKPISFDLSEYPNDSAYGTYWIRERVTNSGDQYCEPLTSEWSSPQKIDIYRRSEKPKAEFTVSSPVETKQQLIYDDKSECNNNWEIIVNRSWVWWNANSPGTKYQGQPKSFDSSGTYYISEQVTGSGNVKSSGLSSDLCVQKVDVYDPTPQNGKLSVLKADYKDPDSNIYWVRPDSAFEIYTEGYFPSLDNIYPDATYLKLVNGDKLDSSTPTHYENLSQSYILGTSFNTYFNFLDKENKAEESTKDNNNYISAIHKLSAKDGQDGTSFELYYANSYKGNISEYEDSEICLNVDGKPPKGSAIIDFDDSTLNVDISVDDVYDDESGVKDVYTELYSSADPNNKIRKDLKLDEDGTWKLPEFNAYSIFKSDDIVIEVYAEDNVGNIGLLGQGTYDLFTVSAQIVPYNNQSSKGIPVLLKGQDAVLRIDTTGSPTELQITFPDKLAALDNTLNRTIKIDPEDYLTTPYEFKIPLDVQDDEADYTVNVKAVKGDKNREANAEMHVTGNILNGIRTRTRSSNAP